MSPMTGIAYNLDCMRELLMFPTGLFDNIPSNDMLVFVLSHHEFVLLMNLKGVDVEVGFETTNTSQKWWGLDKILSSSLGGIN